MTDPDQPCIESAEALGAGFVRQWLFEEVANWHRGDEQTLLVVGAPGTGKSTFSAQLLRHDSSVDTNYITVSSAHFCSRDKFSTIDTLRFIEAVSAGLSGTVSGFTEAVLAEVAELRNIKGPIYINASASAGSAAPGSIIAGLLVRLHGVSALEAFERLLSRPLRNVSASARPVILVDGLDEAAETAGLVSIPQLVLEHMVKLPVRLLLTSRPDSRLTRAVRTSGGRVVDLDTEDSRQDIRKYAVKTLSPYANPEQLAVVADRISSASNGNFLYARYAIIEATRHPTLENFEASSLPQDLFDSYRRFMRQLRPVGSTAAERHWATTTRPLLGAIMVAQEGGLGRTQLADILDLELSQVSDAIREVRQYLSGSDPEGPWRLYHASFGDFLKDPAEDLIDVGEAHAAVARGILRIWGDAWEECDDDYMISEVATHLGSALTSGSLSTGAQRRTRVQLTALLTDPSFLLRLTPTTGLTVLQNNLEAAGGRRVAEVFDLFRGVLHLIVDRGVEERASYLRLSALQHGVDWFADRLTSMATVGSWSADWTRWRPAHPHQVLNGHTGPINALTVCETDDQTLVFSGGSDGTVRVWGFLPRPDLLHILECGQGGVFALKLLTLTGRRILVTAGSDGSIRTWAASDLKPIQRMRTTGGTAIQDLAVKYIEGRAIALCGASGRHVAIRSDTLKAFMVVPRAMHGSLQVWDLSDAKLVAEVLPGDEEGVYAVQLIDDGSDFRVVAAGESWAGVEPFAEIETKEIPRSASFFREWRCAFVDGHVTFVDPTDIIPTAEMSIPPADFEQYNSSVGRRLLFTGGGPGWINAWDVDSGETWPIDVDAEDVEAFGLIREELSTRLICSTRSMSLEVFDADSGEFEAGVRHGHSSDVTAIASLPAHSKVLTAGRDGTIRVWDLPSIDAVSDFPRGSVPNVLGLDVGRLGRTADVLVAGTDEESGEPLLGVCRAHGGGWSLLPGHDVAVRAAAFSTFDESLAASIDAHGVVILWDLQNGTMIHRSEPEEPSEFGFGGCFSNPIFLRDRVLFVTGHTYGTVNIAWLDFTSGRRVESPNQLHGYSVDQVALVGNDRGFYSVSHSFGGDLSVFDLITGKRVLGLSTGEPLQSDTAISAYLLDGEPMLSFLNADRVIEQWQLREASKLGSITTEGLGRVSTMASGREGSHQFHFVGDYSGHVVGVREDGAQVLDLNVEHSVKALVHTDFHRLYVGTGRGIACLRLTQPGI